MNAKVKQLSLGICLTLGTASMLSCPAPSFAGIIPDGDYQIQINVTPSTTSYLYPSYCDAAGGTGSWCTLESIYDVGNQEEGWNSSFTFGSYLPYPNYGDGAMTDNDYLVAGTRGSGIAGDGYAGTIDITVSGDNIFINPAGSIGFQVDTIIYSPDFHFAQYLDASLSGHPLSAMSGTVDVQGNMTFTPTGRLGAIDYPDPNKEILDGRSFVPYSEYNEHLDTWGSFTTGTITVEPPYGRSDVTGTRVVNVGPTLNGDDSDDFTATLVQTPSTGSDWTSFSPIYCEVWNINIVSVNVPPGDHPPTVAPTIKQDGAFASVIIQTGGDVTVTANASDLDLDVLTYNWTVPTGAIITAGGTSADDFVTYDPSGLTILSAAVTVLSVKDNNNPPVSDSVSREVVAYLLDIDGDGLSNSLEDANGNGVVDTGETDPRNPDTDGDGALDGQEDINSNGVVDAGEADPLNPDSDGDGLTDGYEINVGGTDPNTSTIVITGPLGDMDGDGDVDVGDTLLHQRKVLGY